MIIFSGVEFELRERIAVADVHINLEKYKLSPPFYDVIVKVDLAPPQRHVGPGSGNAEQNRFLSVTRI